MKANYLFCTNIFTHLSPLIFTWLIKVVLFHNEETEVLTRVCCKASDCWMCIEILSILLYKYLANAQEDIFISLGNVVPIFFFL